jgi:CCR4-NOT transcription complex subunit 1
MMQHGEEGRPFGISGLLDELDFRTGPGAQKDMQKISVLREEVFRALKRPNFVSILVQSFEGGAREKMLQMGAQVPDYFLGGFCKSLGLSPSQSAVVAFALMHSQYRSLVQEALKLLKAKIPEMTSVSDVTEEAVQGLTRFVVNNEALRSSPELVSRYVEVVRNSPYAPSAFGDSAGRAQGEGGAAEGLGHLSAAARKKTTAAKILIEFGPQCSVNSDTFRSALQEIGVPIDEMQLAEIMVAVLYPYPAKGSSDSENKISFNLEVVSDVLSRECRHLRWPNVCRSLDTPSFTLVNEGIFLTLVKLFIAISGRPLPAVGLMGLWSNRSAQLALLHYSWNTPRNQVDFSDMFQNAIVLEAPNNEDGSNVVPAPQNSSWRCVPLYRTLLDLASSGMAIQVLEVFLQAARLYPEYITIGLAITADHSNLVSTEVLRRVLPLFTGLQGSCRPSFGIVMSKLFEVNQGLLLVLFRMAFKNANICHDVLSLDSRLKSMGGTFAAKLQEGAMLDEILSYWCVLADVGEFPLEGKVSDVLNKNPQLSASVFNFMKNHEQNVRPRSVQPMERGVLSMECMSILGSVLKFYPSVVNQQELADVVSLRKNQGSNTGSGDSGAAAGAGAGPAAAPTSRREPGPGPAGPGGGEQGAQGAGNAPGSNEFEEVEDLANSYFQKIYTADMTIADVIQLLKRFKSSTDQREQEIFRCMIHNLFDEYRFFHKYPEKELEVTGRLFGTLIQHQLVSSITLGIALRYVLEALRKDPEQGGSMEKMFRFGRISLEQFRSRLIEWPQYCSHLIQIAHLQSHCPELYKEAQKSISNPVPPANADNTGSAAAYAAETGGRPPSHPGSSAATAAGVQQQMGAMSLQQQVDLAGGELTPLGTSDTPSAIERMLVVNQDIVGNQPPENMRDQIHFIVNNIAKINVAQKTSELKALLGNGDYSGWFANYLVVKRISTQPNLHGVYISIVDHLDSNALTKAIINSVYHNVTKLLLSSKITTSSSERSLLRNLGIWLGQITLARNRPVLQRRCDLKGLLMWGYESGRLIAVCPFVAKILEGCKESKVFRPPNPWLVSLLGILRELYETEDLKMNIKFEVQVLCKNIDVRIEDVPRSRMLSRLPIPVKEKSPDFNVNNGSRSVPPSPPIGASKGPPSPIISGISPVLPPSVPSGGGFGGSQKSPSPVMNPMQHQSMQQQPMLPNAVGDVQKGAGDLDKQQGVSGLDYNGPQEQTVIPNLASYVNISPSIQFFVKNPAMRRVVPLAVDRAIREIIHAVVERSVTIAGVTTKQLILKDFAQEPNEQNLRRAAHLMISNLAGSMALVTCKEPLRVSIGNHLRSLLAQSISDQSVVEQIVQVCSNDNLELGCMLIEKAATEKAIRDVDERMAPAIQARRKHRETGQPFVDPAIQKNRYPKELPEMLKAKAGGMSQQQLLVYEGFQRHSRTGSAPAFLQKPMDNKTTGTAQQQSAPVLSMSQALEAYQHCLTSLDSAIKTVSQEAQRVTLSQLGADHEILNSLRDIIHITHRIQPRVRVEAAVAFAENVFKHLTEVTAASSDLLHMEVLVGIIEALREACGGAKAFPLDIVSWLNRYSTYNLVEESHRETHRFVLSLLMRANLLRPAEVDVYFSNNLDGGHNMLWVEVALSFVKHCISEDLAATYEFATTFDTVSKMRPANATVRKQLQKWLTDLRSLAAAKDEQKAANSGASAAGGQAGSQAVGGSQSATGREQVVQLLERWMRVWSSSNDQVFNQFLQLMHQYGVLKTEESADRFFRIATDVCIDACNKSVQLHSVSTNPASGEPMTSPLLSYNVIDALAKLFLQLIRLADKENSNAAVVRINLFGRILQAVARSLLEECEAKANMNANFDQRPYYRLFVNLFQDLGPCDPKQDPSPSVQMLLSVFTQVLLAVQPSQVPAFAFSWLQLISHRTILPHFLHSKSQKSWSYLHRLLMVQLLFLQPYLRTAQLSEPIRRLYKGTLRVMLVLLHDFPEFLCDYHVSFCDVIPQTCVQLRNLVLSAFPRSMRLPDPFTPNLKVDLLPEISQSPRILTEYVTILSERGIKARIDSYLNSRQPAEFPGQLAGMFTANAGKLHEISPLISAIVVYIGVQANAMQQQQQQQQGKAASLQSSSSLELFKQILGGLDSDTEGRYYLLNAMANQLRYPNNQTHFFSCILLFLFADADQEILQEQITRILLERLIVHRPHPVRTKCLLIIFCYSFF